MCPLEEIEELIKKLKECTFTINTSDIDLFDVEDLRKASLLASDFAVLASKTADSLEEIENS